MNGYTNEETYQAALWMTNDYDVWQYVRSYSASQLESFLKGMLAVTTSSVCEHTNEIAQQLAKIGDLRRVNYNELSEALRGEK